MTRVLRVLLAVVMVAIPRAAHASLWDWIQEMSGPGPSHGRPGKNVLFTHCFGDKGVNTRGIKIQAASATATGFDKKPCVFYDERHFRNDRDGELPDDNFPAQVNLTFRDMGPTWSLFTERQFMIGAGVGWLRTEGNGVRRTHFTVTPMRMTIAPLALIPGLQGDEPGRRWVRVLKWYYRATLLTGTIDATDFGVELGTGPGQSNFSAKNEIVRSAGFIIDLSPIVFSTKGKGAP